MDLSNSEEQMASTHGADNSSQQSAAGGELSTHVNDGRLAISASDLPVPFINVLNKMSESEINAPVGSLIFDKAFDLAKMGVGVDVVPVFANKSWKEDVPYGSDGVMPSVVYNEAAAKELASRSPYPVIVQARIGFLVRAPEGLDPMLVAAYFPFTLGDEKWAVAQIIAQKRGFDATYKRLASALIGSGRPMWEVMFKLSGEKTSNTKGTWYIPSLKPSGQETPAAVIALAKTIGGAA